MNTELNNQKAKGRWIPNALTISRLIFAIAIVIVLLIKPYKWSIDNDSGIVCYSIQIPNTSIKEVGTWTYGYALYWQYIIAGILFALGCLTDFLDGYLSRKYNWVSDFGKIMDPVADKVLVNSTLIVLSVQNLVFVWITIILIARDILVDATRMVKAKQGVVVPANIWGKLKTVWQMIGILLILFAFNRYGVIKNGVAFGSFNLSIYNPSSAIANIGMYIALIFSITSGIIYEVKMLYKPKEKVANV